jgi:anti-anti-sigma factor
MEIRSTQHNDITVVSIKGSLDANTSAEATAYLDAEIEDGHTKLVIDFSDVSYLSSAGLRVILGTTKKARGAGGGVRLAGAEGNIRRVVDVSGFSKVIKTFPTVKDAVASYTP